MGNALTPCLQGKNRSKTKNAASSSVTKLIFWEGNTRVLTTTGGRGTTKVKHVAGEIMFEFPDKMVCHSDSFFIGKPVPCLAIDDELMPGQTYFILPIDLFSSSDILSTSALAAIKGPNVKFVDQCPFEYVKGENGRISIKVMPEFITSLIISNKGEGGDDDGEYQSAANTTSSPDSFICSTPELKKQYEQLVGSRDQVWSPRLETISEYKIRYSPCRLIGIKLKQKEG